MKKAGVVLFAGLLGWAATGAAQQNVTPQNASLRVGSPEVAVLAQATLTNGVTGNEFVAYGGAVQLHVPIAHKLGVVADLGGAHNGSMASGQPGLDLVTAAFGARYTQPYRHFVFYGEALGGEAFGFHSIFPGSSSANTSDSSGLIQLGGGADYPLRGRYTVRLCEAMWQHTYFPNSTTNEQNHLRLGAGVVLHF